LEVGFLQWEFVEGYFRVLVWRLKKFESVQFKQVWVPLVEGFEGDVGTKGVR